MVQTVGPTFSVLNVLAILVVKAQVVRGVIILEVHLINALFLRSVYYNNFATQSD